MNKIEMFISWLHEQLRSIYVWGAQGEHNLSNDRIRRMETSATNAERAIALKRKRQAEGITDIRAFDCSGLVVCYLIEHGYIKSDTNAAGLYKTCTIIKRDQLKAGDFVFRSNDNGIHHIGVYAGGGMVIHSKGRDAGVVKEHIDYNGENYWNRFGRFELLQEGDTEVAKVIKKGMKGDSIKKLQTALNELGYACGTADGIAGDKTMAAIKAFTKAHSEAEPQTLTVSVQVGNKTYKGEVK